LCYLPRPAGSAEPPGTAHFCALDQAEFSTRNGLHAVKLWVETWPERSFARTLKSWSILRVAWWRGAKYVECAAEDEKQKLNEAMAELQELTTPSMKTPTDPDQREKQQSQLQPPPQR
jgi:hypothetical protein